MIQLIFDKNLESPDFIEIFKSDDSYQPALDAKLIATQKIVEEKVGFFAQIHAEYQTAMLEKLVEDYMSNLIEKEKTNGGFPDTESMRIALFGQIAFRYEQECQDIYKKIKDKVVSDTTEEIT
jgi:hypothetical protein